MSLAEHINEQARTVDRDPSEAQKRAGNYRKGHVRVHGLDISIENPRGSFRSGIADGKRWRSRLPHHYGYIRKTEGGDGDHVDVFIGPHLAAPKVYVIDQINLKSGAFDEHKCFVGFASPDQARAAYCKAFSDGRGEERISNLKAMTVDQFKAWLKTDTTRPIRRAAGGGVYDTRLGPADEMAYGAWKKLHAPNDSGEDYDLRGAYLSGEVQAPDGHMADRFKKPNHPTFSDQSQYATGDERQRAGHWDGDTFVPPAAMRAAGGRVHADVDDYLGHYASGGSVDGPPPFDATEPVSDAPPSFESTQPVEPEFGKARAVWQGAKEGAMLNFNDEILGARAAAPKIPGTDWNIPDFVGPIPARTIAGAARMGLNKLTGRNDPEATAAYEAERDEERKLSETAARQHPYLHMAGEVAGAVPAMAAMPGAGFAARAPLAASKIAKFGRTAADSSILGAEYGALSGLGEGKEIGDRAMKSAEGIVSGIVGGAAAPVMGAGVGAAYNKFAKPGVDAVRGMINPEAEAARRIAAALRADQDMIASGTARGMTPQQWSAARQAGEPVTLADLGSEQTQALLRSAANTSPEGRAMLEKVIHERFLGQGERVADDVRNLVAGGANAGKTADQLVADYDIGRGPLYKRAFSRPTAQQVWSPELEQITQAPVVQQAIRMANVTAKNEAAKIGLTPMRESPFAFDEAGRMTLRARPDGSTVTPNLQYWDAVKKSLDQMGADGRAWSRTLRDHLDDITPEYKDARGFAANFFGERDALEAGRKMAGKRLDPEAIRTAMRQMKPDERELFREGYASDWANRVIGNISETRDITKAIFNSPNERARALAVFGPAGVAKMEARMALETIMDGARRAMGNSTTARQLIEAGLAGGALGGYLEGDWKGALAGAGAGLGARAGLAHHIAQPLAEGAKKLVGKVDAKTARLVAELLTSNDPAKLQQGLRMAQKNQRIADGLRSMANRLALSGQSPARVPIDTTGWGSVAGRAEDKQQEAPRP